MRCKLHLISMPWANPELPSIQIATLEAYVNATFGKKVPTQSYSAFTSICLKENRTGHANFFETFRDFEEYPYFLIYLRRFLNRDRRLRQISLPALLKKMNSSIADIEAPLTLRKLAQLEHRTCRYIDETIVPKLSRRSVNVVGFTLNYYQLYASLFCARYLAERYPNYRYLFVFGGATVIYPKVAAVLKTLGVQGICVIGEGERKLELLLKEVLNTPAEDYPNLMGRLTALHDAIYDIQHQHLDLYQASRENLLNLQMPVNELPMPAFTEYYASLSKAFVSDRLHAQFKAESWLAMEGTRGCFAKCDFCDVHMSWSGFRKGTPERVVDDLLELTKKHRTGRVKFMDNVCDTWAEKYAELLIKRNIQIESFMECRVHHPEIFWTKLALSGVKMVQVGIEALSPTLIKAMRKGTSARQNLLVQKWLKELEIESLSNLITHHPKSTIADVRETKRVLQLIPHLDRLDFSNLALLIGTPLYRELRPDEIPALEERQPFTLPKSLDKYFVLKGEYEPPDRCFRKGVNEAWDELIAWEDKFFKAVGEQAFMSAMRYGVDTILIRDGRYGEVKEYHLYDARARIYNLSHQGSTLASLQSETDLPDQIIEKHLSWLIARKLLVKLDGFYISLALRPRDELIQNYHDKTASQASVLKLQPRPNLPIYSDTVSLLNAG